MTDEELAGLRDRLEKVEARLASVSELLSRLVPALEEIPDLQAELNAFQQDMVGLQDSRDELVSQVSILQQAFKALELRLRRSEAARGLRPAGAAIHPPPPRPPAPTPPPTSAPAPAPVAVEAGFSPTAAGAAESSAKPPPSPSPATTLAVRHLEGDITLRDVVRATTERWSGDYGLIDTPVPRDPGIRRILVVNLLAVEPNPFEVLANWRSFGLAAPEAFTYCSDGAHCVVLGPVRYCPPPFDAGACTQYLLGHGGIQKVLTVSGDLDSLNALKDRLTKAGCTVSMAFDGRQALDLAPMLKVDLVLIDLLLPHGEAFRLAGRLRTSAATARVPLAFLWTREISAGQLYPHAAKMIRDSPLSIDELTRTLSQALRPSDAGL